MKFVETFLADFVKKSNENGYDQACLDDSNKPELPSTIIWVYHYLAQQLLLDNRYDQALEYVQKAIAHTPTLVDLYTLKAKILKRKGDLKV